MDSGFRPTAIPAGIIQQSGPYVQNTIDTSAPAQGGSASSEIPASRVAGNSSRLLQSFVIARNSLDSVGLRRPLNAGDTEMLLAEISLIIAELSGDNETSRANNQASRAIIRSLFERFNINSIAAARAQIEVAAAELGRLWTLDTTDLPKEEVDAIRVQIGILNRLIATLNSQIERATFIQSFIDFFIGLIGLPEAVSPEFLENLSFFVRESSEQEQSEILSDFQEILEVDLEDTDIQEYIAELSIEDINIEKAQIVSFGLLGSFFEALGVFFQQADLVELDLDPLARANNKQQRLQVTL